MEAERHRKAAVRVTSVVPQRANGRADAIPREPSLHAQRAARASLTIEAVADGGEERFAFTHDPKLTTAAGRFAYNRHRLCPLHRKARDGRVAPKQEGRTCNDVEDFLTRRRG